ncbi:Crp/Fnr family transcriptional regulator [Rhizobium sp. 25PS6]|uniref:Crp/Fnr family transcriptional regulator n=1 Tax=Rhizobium aouanii TaxID=3118145 RepID=A0ABU8CVU3_9HYPH|nr:Crp/Fnr family transcriptional regulator [Rhizobium sp. 25PS6]MDU0364330.1 Crp/Fnr family transcriptional regulator [Rhizobium sp. 25PS6]
MANSLTMKLEQFIRFEQLDRQRLDRLLSFPTKTFARGDVIIEEGKEVRNIHLLLTGLAARAKVLADGRRQIMAFLVPGDLCDVEVFVLRAMDHNIVAMTDTTCVLIPAEVIEGLLTESSNITKALWWGTMVDSGILREWIIDHGRRGAREQIAHMFYEMLIRHRIVGETTDDSFSFPITQDDLADATGLTPPHVNKTLQELRAAGLIEFKNKVLTVLDAQRLRNAANYESGYLHLNRTEKGDHEVSERAGDLVSAAKQSMLGRAVHNVTSAIKHSR